MIPFDEFLQLVKVVKMLYGREPATKLLENNLHKYYNLDSASIRNLIKGE